MKLHFEPNLDYQMQAIEAVCDLFRGQEVCRTEFTVTMKAPPPVADDMFPGTQPEQLTLGVAESDLGVGNRLTLLDDELHKNLADIQLRGGLPPSITLASGDFTVEMETGTGKTYVYLRSIFELNKRYGMGGLLEHWEAPQGEIITFTILTTTIILNDLSNVSRPALYELGLTKSRKAA